MSAVCADQIDYSSSEYELDIFPTVGWNGDVVLPSPEFLGMPGFHYGDFTVGNVLEEPFGQIIARAPNVDYVADFIAGIEDCKKTCPYFAYCGGEQASNKFFELGSTDGTETVYCRNAKKTTIECYSQYSLVTL